MCPCSCVFFSLALILRRFFYWNSRWNCECLLWWWWWIHEFRPFENNLKSKFIQTQFCFDERQKKNSTDGMLWFRCMLETEKKIGLRSEYKALHYGILSSIYKQFFWSRFFVRSHLVWTNRLKSQFFYLPFDTENHLLTRWTVKLNKYAYEFRYVRRENSLGYGESHCHYRNRWIVSHGRTLTSFANP